MQPKAPSTGRKKKAAVDDPVERFRRAAAAFNARANATRETALETLVKEGIYTRSGKLSKIYPVDNRMQRLAFSFVLGYHGCDRAVGEALLAGKPFQASRNDYDWLGPGIYFWEANPRRALSFAMESQVRSASKIREPYVVGAVIDLGNCLDLTTTAGVEQVRIAYESLRDGAQLAGSTLPTNSADHLRRHLDCAVIKRLHSILEDVRDPAIDTVRGRFVEGAAAYPGSGIHEKTHIQIAVRNGECVKGVFRVSEGDLRG